MSVHPETRVFEQLHDFQHAIAYIQLFFASLSSRNICHHRILQRIPEGT